MGIKRNLAAQVETKGAETSHVLARSAKFVPKFHPGQRKIIVGFLSIWVQIPSNLPARKRRSLRTAFDVKISHRVALRLFCPMTCHSL